MKNYIRCKKCGSCISVNTNSELIWCACGTVGVDSNKYCTRILGGSENYKIYNDEKREEF